MSNTSEKEFNSKRKDLLLLKDQNAPVSNVQLGMYGLTTYYGKEDFDCSMAEKILFNKLESNKILHDGTKDIYLMEEQARVLNLLKNHKRMILMAPTSFGKTLLIKEYIYRTQPHKVVIIVPTNSLAYELELSFKKNKMFTDICKYRVFDKFKTGDIKSDSNYLFVGTQEKYLEIEKSFGFVDLFIIDEAYKLKETTQIQRNYRLSKVFLDNALNSSKQLFLLSPNSNFIGFDSYNFHKENVTFNGVDKVYTVVNDNVDFYKELNRVSKENKTLFFCKKPAEITETFDKIEKNQKSLNQFANFLADEFHEDWSVVKYLRKGVLVHHGQMPKFVQNRMQHMFVNDEKCKLLLCTNSVSEGINTPAKNIFISSSFAENSDDVMLLKNTVGRAGRLGVFPIGHIYSTREIEEDCEKENTIVLAVANDDELDEVKESLDELKIKSTAEIFGLTQEDFSKIMKDYSISLAKLRLLLEQIKVDYKFPGPSNLINIASKIFTKDYHPMYKFKDYSYIKAYLQNSAKVGKEMTRLDTFKDKITYCSTMLNLSISDSIDEYMSFIYSRLQFCILPVAKICKFLKENYENYPFGKNVIESCDTFIQKYYLVTYGNVDFANLSEQETKIVLSLQEYGVSFRKVNVNKEMIGEINNLLGNEFSTVDIINAIEALSDNSVKYSNSFKLIYNNYLSY